MNDMCSHTVVEYQTEADAILLSAKYGDIKLIIAKIVAKFNDRRIKMKIPCDLIFDLLPLYQRGLCSENSEMIITEHLTVCDACYEILSKMDEKVDIPRYEQNLVKLLALEKAKKDAIKNSQNG